MNCDKVLKDINFMEMQADLKQMLVECTQEKKLEILDILRKDSKFLREHGIIDYSLLLAIEDAPNQSERFSLNVGNYLMNESRNNIGNLHIGIIDYLQAFNFSKKAETWWKTNVLGKKKEGLSSAPADIYQARFVKFMEETVLAMDKEDYYKWV